MSPTESQNNVLSIDLLAPHQSYYNKRGKQVVSVTTLTGMAKPSLDWWHNMQGLSGIDTQVYVQRCADIGTITHARIEAALRGMLFSVKGLDEKIVEESGYGYERFMQWWDQHRYTMIETEKRMVSEKLQCGGTLDIMACSPKANRVLLDVKATAGIHREHKIQVAGAYAPMYTEITKERVDQVWIVRVGRGVEGKLEVVQIHGRRKYEAAFRALVKVRRALDRLPEVVAG